MSLTWESFYYNKFTEKEKKRKGQMLNYEFISNPECADVAGLCIIYLFPFNNSVTCMCCSGRSGGSYDGRCAPLYPFAAGRWHCRHQKLSTHSTVSPGSQIFV